MQKKGWLALCPTNYTFNILYCSFFPHQLVHSLSYIFFLFYFLIHTRQVTRTPQFPLFSDSVLNFLSSLSFYVVFLFLLLFFPLCASSSTVQLISASSHLTFLHFSLKFFTLGFLFCFIFFVRYVCLLHFFLLLLFFFFLVEILVLQSKLHVGRIWNFDWYLSRVS